MDHRLALLAFEPDRPQKRHTHTQQEDEGDEVQTSRIIVDTFSLCTRSHSPSLHLHDGRCHQGRCRRRRRTRVRKGQGA